MGFVDEVNFLATHEGEVVGRLQNGADVVNAGVRSGVNFNKIWMRAVFARNARRARFAGKFSFFGVFLEGLKRLTIDHLGDDASDGCFATAALSVEQIHGKEFAKENTVLEHADNKILADNVSKFLWAERTGKMCGVLHGFFFQNRVASDIG